MKRLGRVVGAVLAVMLAVFSLQALAETPLAGRDFNHNATGFPLSGVHALTACEICHVAGVFKGTPRNCDGCHALGKRVVATPKSTSHIVTDAPCDSCHFNASTFLGARFNHGTALPGQCRNCHNGRQSLGKPASHASGNKALNSCDQCHRSYTWFNASWNHAGVLPHTCDNSNCHVQGANQYFRSTATHAYTATRTGYCDDCHNFVTWTPRHIVPTKLCSGCHNDIDAKGTLTFPGHMPIPAGQDCQSCHSITTASTSWAGGKYNHVGVVPGSCANAGCHISGSNRFTVASHVYSPRNYSLMSTSVCDSCHTTRNWTPSHITPTGLCSSCHDDVLAKGKASYTGHIGTTANCTDCHTTTTATQTSSWAGAIGGLTPNHIPYNAGVVCGTCHVGAAGSLVNTNTLHANSNSHTCAECHISPNSYTGSPSNNQKTKSTHKGSAGNNCSSCHNGAASYSNWNA